MRERLFKGFHPDENGKAEITLNGKKIKGEWIEGDLLHPDTEIGVGYSIELLNKQAKNNCLEVLPETVCEYVKDDCKGNKVFENDIVKIDYTDIDVGLIKITGQIVWNKDIGGYLIHETAYCRNYDIRYHEEMEVVGNVFDKPNF